MASYTPLTPNFLSAGITGMGPATNPSRQVTNILSARRGDLSNTAVTLVGSGTATVAPDFKSINMGSGGAGRAFVGFTENLALGFYIFSIRISNCSSTFTNQNISVANGGTSPIGVVSGTLNAINGNNNGRLYIPFQVTTAGNITLRYGIGLPSNEVSGTTLTVSEPMLESVTSLSDIPSEYVPPYTTGSFNYYKGITTSSGKYIVFAKGADIPNCVINAAFFHGDSFQNEITEFPFLTGKQMGIGFYPDGLSGRTLETGISEFTTGYNLTSAVFIPSSSTGNSIAANWTTDTTKANIVVCELNINDIIQGKNITQMEAFVRSYISTVRGVNPKAKIVMFTASPCSTNVNWTSAIQAVIVQYNSLIKSLATELGFSVLDRYTILGNPSNPTQLNPAYEKSVGPDGLHPGDAGEQALTDGLKPIISYLLATS